MGLEQWEIEGAADGLYIEAGLSPPTAPSVLARALLGPDALHVVHAGCLPGDGALARVRDEWRIYVRCRLPVPRLRAAVCHELAEWHLARVGYREPDTEAVADAIAAAILTPRALFAREARGRTWHQLARLFAVTESCVALREGEVRGTPLALITPARVRVRGSEFAWPDEASLRRLASGRLPAMLQRRRLRDESRRVALVAA